ncbi:MAG: hypothetical protein V7719_17615 [Psychroserpens sp.]|uniref:hypothetical protein n=1 Tax=Psychroserpens sp. TaxID=2020870 RepID=UPI0030025EC8
MNSRWYISTLIIIFTLLGGIANKEQFSEPNQEIVLQFASDEVNSLDAQQAINIVKQQLQDAGVENIQVQKQNDGQLKITYYSNSDVNRIKKLLSKEAALEIGYVSQDNNQSKIPSEDHTIAYDLDIYEIQHGDDLSASNGKLALEAKAETDRLLNPNVFVSAEDINTTELDHTVKVTYKFRKDIAIDNRSRKIPEVRAGPEFYGICNFG